MKFSSFEYVVRKLAAGTVVRAQMEKLLDGYRILVVDDEHDLRAVICDELSFYGAQVFEAANGTDGYLAFLKSNPNVVITDVRMPNGDGIELLRKIRDAKPVGSPSVLVMSGQSGLSQVDVIKLGGHDLVEKPFALEALRKVIVSCPKI